MTNCFAPSAPLHAIGMPTLSVGPTNHAHEPGRIAANLQCVFTTLLSRSTLVPSARTITVDLASPPPRVPAAVPPSAHCASFERP
jgi:hypothetical protein